MTAVPRAGVRRGTVFTRWAWLALAPFLLTAYGGYDAATTLRDQLDGFGVAVAVHLALGAAFLIAAAVDALIGPAWARVLWAIAAFSAMAVTRPMLVDALHDLTGVPGVDTPFGLRVAMNLFSIAGACLVVSALADAFRRTRAVQSRLDEVLRTQEAQAAAADAARQRILAEFETGVAVPVRRALERARVIPFDAIEQAAALRAAAHDVVRPLSHRVFDEEPHVPPVPVHAARERGYRLPSRIVAATFWWPVLVYAIVMYPSLLNGYGPLGGLLRLLPAAAIALGGNALIGLIRIRRPWQQLVAIAVGYIAVGLAMAWVFLDTDLPLLPAPTRELVIPIAFWIYVPLAYLFVAVLVSVIRSAMLELAEVERALSAALVTAEREATAARTRLVAASRRVARVLHNQVQGEIVAVSLRLRLGSAGERDVDELIERIDRTLRLASAGKGDEPAEGAADAVAASASAVLETWSSVMDIEADAGPEPWAWLAERPEAAAIMLDAVTEGLTNAVRHASAPWARLAVRRTDDGVRLTVRTPGRLHARSSDGIGLTDLAARGAEVGLEQDGRAVVFTVALRDDGERAELATIPGGSSRGRRASRRAARV